MSINSQFMQFVAILQFKTHTQRSTHVIRFSVDDEMYALKIPTIMKQPSSEHKRIECAAILTHICALQQGSQINTPSSHDMSSCPITGDLTHDAMQWMQVGRTLLPGGMNEDCQLLYVQLLYDYSSRGRLCYDSNRRSVDLTSGLQSGVPEVYPGARCYYSGHLE